MTKMDDTGREHWIDRANWEATRLVARPLPAALDEGQVLFRVDRFALTSNNISYITAGDMLGYWKFFPADEGFGRVPAMGYGDVVASAHPEIAVGGRYFGFFPLSTHLVVEARPSAEGLVDAAAHRQDTAPAYRQYARSDRDPFYHPDFEDQVMLLRGLFMTSFLADDFLADQDYFGAKRVLVSSASSKTAIALAFQLAKRPEIEAIGLTSEQNRAFTEGLALYDRVCSYDEVPSLEQQPPAVFVDMAGNASVVRAIHEHLGDQLRYNCVIGATHVGAGGGSTDLPGPTPEFFFAPSQIQKRSSDWGPVELQKRLGGAWTAFRENAGKWLEVVRGYGPDAVERVYQELLGGRVAPNQGQILSMWPEA